MKLKHYLVYLITNTVNNKIYVGKHETYDPDDEYMGSGHALKRAQRKYGIDKFTKTILADFDEPWSMANMEAVIVDEEFIKRKDTYNITLGGTGGFYHVNSQRSKWSEQQWSDFGKKISEKVSPYTQSPERRAISARILKEYNRTHENPMKGKHRSLEYRRKQSERFTGERNPNFGKHWLFDEQGNKHGVWDGQGEIQQGLFTKEQLIELRDNQLPHQFQGSVRAHRKLRWINNGKQEQYISVNEVEGYLTLGWQRGRLKINCFTKH